MIKIIFRFKKNRNNQIRRISKKEGNRINPLINHKIMFRKLNNNLLIILFLKRLTTIKNKTGRIKFKINSHKFQIKRISKFKNLLRKTLTRNNANSKINKSKRKNVLKKKKRIENIKFMIKMVT